MIVFDDTLVAHYGGPRGAVLSLAEPGGAFRPAVDFGLDPKSKAAPQRRLLLTSEHLFVLEPAEGVLFDEMLRVRRFDRQGNELSVVEGRGEEGRAQLATRGTQEPDGGPLRLACFGVDPETGRPLRWEREVVPNKPRGSWTFRSSPVWLGDEAWVPYNQVSLFHFSGGSYEEIPIAPGPLQVLGGRVYCCTWESSKAAIWADGERRVIWPEPLYPGARAFSGAFLAPRPDGGSIVLRAAGGELPGLEGAPGRLPPGIYSGFVWGPAGVFGIEESTGPRMVPAEL